MKIIKIICLYGSVIILSLFSVSVYSQVNTSPVNKPAATSDNVKTKHAALALDRGNGFYFGWAADYSTLAEAEKKAIEECNKKGGRCTIVLSFSGPGCAAPGTPNSSLAADPGLRGSVYAKSSRSLHS